MKDTSREAKIRRIIEDDIPDGFEKTPNKPQNMKYVVEYKGVLGEYTKGINKGYFNAILERLS